MRFYRAAALTITVTMFGSGCWQGDRLIGYVSTAARDDDTEAGVEDAATDSTNDAEAQVLPCVDTSAYPGGGTFKSDITDVSGMALNGDAAVVNGVLRLATASLTISSGSVFVAMPAPFDANTSVYAHFAIQIGGGMGLAGADGMAFVLQSSPAGPMALGKSGESLGYADVLPSVAIEIDTHANMTDPPGPHIALIADGDTTRHIESAVTPFDLNDGVIRYLWIDYDGSLDELEVYLSSNDVRPITPLLTHVGFDFSASLGRDVYLGLSASTGGSRNDHDLVGQAWFVTTPQPKCR